MYNDDRAVSIAVGYVLNLAIATILFSALLIGGSGLIESQTRTVTHDELSVTGQQLASELSDADRLVRAGDESDLSELRLRTALPDRTAAGGYTIEIVHAGTEGTIELRSTNPEVVVEVEFRSETSVDTQSTRLRGGSVVIEYETGSGELVVSSA